MTPCDRIQKVGVWNTISFVSPEEWVKDRLGELPIYPGEWVQGAFTSRAFA